MATEVKLHPAQMSIVRALLFTPESGFAELQRPTGLDSDHFKFHISKLVEIKLVEKVTKGRYRLSQDGKEFANKLDTDSNTVERQPKVSVALIVERKGKNGRREFLYQQRLKNPYYGFWGRLGGKVRWGEKFAEAASRELHQETGLTASFAYKMLYHKTDYKTDGTLLEDKLFIVMYTDNAKGDLVERFEGGLNCWMTQDEFLKTNKRFESAYEFSELVDNNVSFVEKDHIYNEDEY